MWSRRSAAIELCPSPWNWVRLCLTITVYLYFKFMAKGIARWIWILIFFRYLAIWRAKKRVHFSTLKSTLFFAPQIAKCFCVLRAHRALKVRFFFPWINFFCQDGSNEVSHIPQRGREVCLHPICRQLKIPSKRAKSFPKKLKKWPLDGVKSESVYIQWHLMDAHVLGDGECAHVCMSGGCANEFEQVLTSLCKYRQVWSTW